MPQVETTERSESSSGEAEFEALRRWMETKHKGFQCKLVAREIPGAGRGLFASEKIAAGETILEIPSSALVNPLTLGPSTTGIPDYLYPTSQSDSSSSSPHPAKKAKTTRLSITATNARRLNTTQLLTLYLALHRDPRSRKGSPWSAYLATLPESFTPWHPLTWYYRAGYDGWWQRVIEVLPVSARLKLEDVKRRYEEDAEVLKDTLTTHDPFKTQKLYPSKITDDTLLWAWLNVNTRTVSIPLDLPGPSALNNHTLVPILDMLNHSSKPEEIIPRPIQIPSSSTSTTGPGASTSRRGGTPHLVPGKIGFRLIAPYRGLEKDEQVRFEYGAHSTETLFTEYGFTPEEKYGDWLSQPHGEVDVNDLVEQMFPIKSGKIKNVLEEIGCWQRNMIYTFPKPAHASHGLIMTLRLFHHNKVKNKRNAEILEEIRLGLETGIDVYPVERDTRRSLIDLCAKVWSESGTHCGKLGAPYGMMTREDGSLLFIYGAGPGQGEVSNMDQALESIHQLWSEREKIARKLKTGIAAGQVIRD